MRTKKTPYSAANSLRLIPIGKINRFALIMSRAFVSFQNGDYEIPGTQQTPLAFTYAKVAGQYQCKLTGIMSHSEAFYSPF